MNYDKSEQTVTSKFKTHYLAATEEDQIYEWIKTGQLPKAAFSAWVTIQNKGSYDAGYDAGAGHE